MENGKDDDDIDVEALQAQVDLSMAYTQSLVASWLEPNYGQSSSSMSRAQQDKEIEELLKRPARCEHCHHELLKDLCNFV